MKIYLDYNPGHGNGRGQIAGLLDYLPGEVTFLSASRGLFFTAARLAGPVAQIFNLLYPGEDQ